MENETSDRLKRLGPEIMEIWVERTLKKVKASHHQGKLALKNSLPVYLAQLVDALSNTMKRTIAQSEAASIDSARIGKQHGKHRALSSEYTIDQLILEYQILRQVIFEVLEKEKPLSTRERDIIVASVEQAVNVAATEFSDITRDFQDHLSHTLAHDLRNPLSTVKATAQLLAKHLKDQNQLKHLERITRASDRIDSMIKQLLNESRMKANERKSMEFKKCDLDWLARDIAAELNISNADRFEVESSGECLGVWDTDCLRRVIENLATNAIKHGEKDRPVTFIVFQDGPQAFFKVHNFGDPIPKEEWPKLFQKFTKSNASEKKAGWGIGLAVVKEMVDSHRGQIDVESGEGGTTFTVRIPKAPLKAQAP